MLIIAAAFFVVCVSILLDGADATQRFPRWYKVAVLSLGATFSAFLIGLAIAELLRPTRLILTPNGLSKIGLWQISPIAWRDIDEFTIHRQWPHKHLGYKLTDEARARRPDGWRRLAAFGTSDGVLMSGPGGTPEHVLRLLQDHHRTAISVHAQDSGAV
jgi:hypothetical protein